MRIVLDSCLLIAAFDQNDDHKAFKRNTHFELLKGVPVRMDLTEANARERAVLQACLPPDRVYVLDRGHAKFGRFRAIIEASSSWACRIRDNGIFEAVQERDLPRIEIQTYLAIMACLLIARWTGKKPTLRTYEMICHYFVGLGDEEELRAHIKKLHLQSQTLSGRATCTSCPFVLRGDKLF